MDSGRWTVYRGMERTLVGQSTQQRLIGPALEQLSQMNPNRRDWDREKIQATIPHYEESVLRIKLSKTEAPDKLSWLKTNSGDYTTKSGYWTAYEMMRRNDEYHTTRRI